MKKYLNSNFLYMFTLENYVYIDLGVTMETNLFIKLGYCYG